MGPAFIALFALGAVLAAGFCALISLDQIEQNQYGLVFNWVTKSIGIKVYHGGTHMIGFWNKFIVFPATVQTIEFSDRPMQHKAPSLHTRTKEGLALHLNIAFQYKLLPDEIPQLYALTNEWYESLYMRLARDQLLEAASDYEGPQYWLQRKEIGDHMRMLVNQQLQTSHAVLWGLQLLDIDLPNDYEASITKTQVERQLVKTRRNEQVAASIRADTEVMMSDYNRRVRVVQAGAEAEFQLTTKLAEAEAAKRRIAAEASVLDYVREKLKLSPNGAVEYQQLAAYAGLENATFLANVLGATPVIHAGSTAGSEPVSSSLVQQGRQELFDAGQEADAGSRDSAASPTPAPQPGDGPDLIMKGRPAGTVQATQFLQASATFTRGSSRARRQNRSSLLSPFEHVAVRGHVPDPPMRHLRRQAALRSHAVGF
jgi:regulator of protease activity HflC (stomatin/prohibitin superfamily)